MSVTPPLVPRADWDPWFDRDRPHFAPVRAAADRFRGFAHWPTPADWNVALADRHDLRNAREQRIRFVPQGPRPPRGRRRRAGVALDALYDGRIYTAGEVP